VDGRQSVICNPQSNRWAGGGKLRINWDTGEYDLGDGYGHIAIGVEDIEDACRRVRELGGRVTREPGPMKHGTTVLAFVEDPDGYKIEFIQV
jgi:lactoylglutathione lyase